MKKMFDITGMACSACSAHVEKAVAALHDVNQVNVNLLQNNMSVEFDEENVTEDDICQAVEQAGYHASPSEWGNRISPTEERTLSEEKTLKQRLIWSVVFLIPLMYVAMGHMIHLPLPAFLTGMEHAVWFGVAQLILVLPVMYINRKFYVGGFQSLVRLAPNMDALIAIGSGAAFVYGIFSIIQMGIGLINHNMALVRLYHGSLYFESVSMILTLITVGKYLEARSKKRTSQAIEKLIQLAPEEAVILVDGVEKTIPVEQIACDDIIVMRTGERFPVDGVVVEGTASVDESALTGESMPISKMCGDTIMSASINQSGYVHVRATRVGEDTTLSQITRLVEEAASSKAPISRLADKIAGIFVPIVIGIALITFITWMILGWTGVTSSSFAFAFSNAIAVLVISCPCALGLATPTAIMVGTGKGAQNGILIKSAESLETAHELQIVVLDKTGTITKGMPEVTDFGVMPGMTGKKVLANLAAIEKMSEHPLALAILEYCKNKGVTPAQATDYQAVPGEGVKAVLEGTTYSIGNEKMMNQLKISIQKEKVLAERMASEGKTVLYFAGENTLLAMVAIADAVKPTSKEAIELLKKMGLEVVMLTGDYETTAQAIKQQMNIDRVIAEVLPAQKDSVIQKIMEQGKKVAMVGDGINDAPALVRSDVGIAIGAGTDVAMESADIVLMKSDLLDVAKAIRLSKAVIRNIKENLFWAFFYNVLGIPLAAGVFYPLFGWQLNPMFAAFAMSMSSLFVVGNALRLNIIRRL